jgi:hypothetical protein
MDEKSILMMSEELRAAMGEQVRKLISDPIERQEPQAISQHEVVVVLGRLVRYAALKDGLVRVSFDTSANIGSLHDRCPFDLHLADRFAELDMTIHAVKSVTIRPGEQTRYSLIVDAQKHK